MAEARSGCMPIQQTLYELGKPALQLVRFVGYFPFRASKTYGITASYRRAPFLWSMFLCATALFKIFNFHVLIGFNASVRTRNFDKVEAFCQLLLTTTAIIAVFSLTLKGILTMKQAVNFWNRNCSLLQEFTDLHPSLNFCIQSNQYQKLFQKIARKIKFPCIFIWFYGIITPAVLLRTRISPLGVKHKSDAVGFHRPDGSWVSMTISIGLQASISISYLYMSLAAYMALFLMVYSACLKIIATELKKLSGEHNKDNLKLSEMSVGSPYSPYLEAWVQETREVAVRNYLRGYQLIEDLVAEFNSQFSFEMIVDACKSISSVLVFAFFVITRGVDPAIALVTIGPALVMGLKLFALATEATEVKTGADTIACELQKLDMDKLTVGTRAKVYTFAVKLCPLIRYCFQHKTICRFRFKWSR